MDRSERVSEEIRTVVSDILRNDIRDPRLPLIVSVTHVKVTRDLSHANIYISVFGTDEEKANCHAALKSANSFIRREIAHRIRLRIAPEVHFLTDDTIERGIKMSKLIDETIKSDREKSDNGVQE
ncbi:MAG: 30S ribosome-binding factor RbfA [Saccharofermentanales bacterium]